MIDEILIRPASLLDLDDLADMAADAESGLTSLPRDKVLLRDKIFLSQQNFCYPSNKVASKDSVYVFVVEDLRTNEVIGTCSILVKTNREHPQVLYRQDTIRVGASPFQNEKDYKVLKYLLSDEAFTEVGGLFLKKEYRKKGIGRFLSRSRFLFLAQFQKRFLSPVLAELRGVNTPEGRAPFWDCLGRNFLNIDFEKAVDLRTQSKDFIEKCIPPMSIFVDLLPADVQAVIGRCHLNSVPALKLLMKEGFSFTDTIDVVDGGPRVMAELSEIDTVKHARCATYKKLDDHFVLSPDLYMVGNMQLPVYKACCTKILISDEGEVSLPPDVARRLGIPVGLEFYYDELFTQRSMDIAVAELNDQQSKPFLRRVAEWYKTASISSKIRG